MTRSDELDALYDLIAEVPEGELRLPILGQAIALAEEAGDEESLYELRCALIGSANEADDSESEVASFSWVLDRHLSNPARFPLEVYEPTFVDIAWMNKWVLHTLMQSSAIGRAQIEACLAGMEDLYRRNGLGMSAPTMYRLDAARYLGDVAALPELLERAQATSTDEYSDCEACTPHDLASAELMLGETELAFERAKQALATRRSCLEEPQLLLAELVPHLLRVGDLETAVSYFHRCLDKVWDSASARLNCYANLVAATAITGNVVFGIDLLERRLSDLVTVIHDHSSRMQFFSGAALLLDRAHLVGLGARPIRDTAGVLAAQSVATGLTVDELRPAFWAEATRLADAFDARAGNTYFRGWLDERRALADLDVSVDLGFEGTPPTTRTQPLALEDSTPVTAKQWRRWALVRDLAQDLHGGLHGIEEALRLEELEGEDLIDALASRAWHLAKLAQQSADVTTIAELSDEDRIPFYAAYAAYDKQLHVQGMDDRLKVLNTLGIERYDEAWDPDPDDLAAILADHLAQGTPEAELVTLESHLAQALFRRGRETEAVPHVIAARDIRLRSDDPQRVLAAHLDAASVFVSINDPQAKRELDIVLKECSSSTSSLVSPSRLSGVEERSDERSLYLAEALRLSTILYARAGDWAEAVDAARRAVNIYVGLDAPEAAVSLATIQAELCDAAADPAEAISVTRRAIDLAGSLESFDTSDLRLDLARRMLRSGDAASAVTVLKDLDRLLQERREPVGSETSYDCAYLLGVAFKEVDDPNRAIAVWKAAFDVAMERGASGATVAFGRALGTVFAEYSIWDEALPAYEAAMAAASEPIEKADLSAKIGLIRCASDDEDGLLEIDEAIRQIRALDAPQAVTEAIYTRARALAELGRTDEAVAAALECSDLFAESGNRGGRMDSLGYAAALLANSGRVADAIGLLSPIVDSGDDPETANLRAFLDQLRDD